MDDLILDHFDDLTTTKYNIELSPIELITLKTALMEFPKDFESVRDIMKKNTDDDDDPVEFDDTFADTMSHLMMGSMIFLDAKIDNTLGEYVDKIEKALFKTLGDVMSGKDSKIPSLDELLSEEKVINANEILSGITDNNFWDVISGLSDDIGIGVIDENGKYNYVGDAGEINEAFGNNDEYEEVEIVEEQ